MTVQVQAYSRTVGGKVVQVAAHERSDPPAGGRMPDRSSPPGYVRDLFAKKVNEGVWTQWQETLDARKDLTPTRRMILSEIFAAEGGLAANERGSSAVGGMLSLSLAQAQERHKSDYPELKEVRSPRDLTPDQRVFVMEDHLNTALRNAGGLNGLEKIGDPFSRRLLRTRSTGMGK